MPPILPTTKRFLGYLVPYRLKLAIIVLLMVVFAVTNAIFSLLLGSATDIISAGHGPTGPLVRVIAELTTAGFLIWVSGTVSQKFLSDISQEALFRIRTELFSHIQTLSLDFFDRRPIGELMSRVTNDTQVIEQFISIGALQTGQEIFTILITSIVMVIVSPTLTLLSYLVVLALVGVSWLITRTSGPAFVLLQEKTGDLNGFAEEWISGAKTVIACRRQDESSRRMGTLSGKVASTGEKAQFSALISQQVSNIFTTILIVVILVAGGLLVMEGMAEIGMLIAFIAFSFALLNAFTTIFSVYGQILNAIVGAARVFEVLDEKPSVADPEGAPAMPTVTGDVVFEHVDFSYIRGAGSSRTTRSMRSPGRSSVSAAPPVRARARSSTF